MIQITTQKAKLGLQTNNAKLEYSHPKGTWEMRTEKSEMEILKEPLGIIIDQSECFAQAGLKTLPMLVEEYADLGRQYAMEGIVRRAREGDMMARPPYGNAIVNIIKGKMPQRADFNIMFIPQSRPRIDFSGLEMDIKWKIGGSQRTFHSQKPQFDYKAGGVEVYMLQYQEIKFQYDEIV